MFEAAPGFVKQLRNSEEHRNKALDELRVWQKKNPVHITADGLLEYVFITVLSYPFGISYRGHYYTRSGGTTRELTGVPLSSFLMERAGKHWDGIPMQGITVDDLDGNAIEEYRKKAGWFLLTP